MPVQSSAVLHPSCRLLVLLSAEWLHCIIQYDCCLSDEAFMPAGDGVEQLKWRLENGELPPRVPPEVIVLAIGTNSKGLVRTASRTLLCFTFSIPFLHSYMPKALLFRLCRLVPAWLSWEAACCKLYRAGRTATLPTAQDATSAVSDDHGSTLVQVGECRLPWAEENAAVMTALLRELRKALPRTRIVLLAPLPKGEYWPNRCTPAFQIFNRALQVRVCLCMTGDHGSVRVPLKVLLQQALGARLRI